MRILLFSIKIFCIYSEQSRGLILALGDGCSSSQSQRSTLVSYSEPLSKNPKNLKQKDVLFLSNDSFQELEVLFPRCWRRTFCLLLLLFNWWAFIFFMDVEECRWTFTAWWYVGGSLSRTAQQCVEEKHVFCRQVYSYFTVLKYFTQQLLLFKQRYTSNKVSLNL